MKTGILKQKTVIHLEDGVGDGTPSMLSISKVEIPKGTKVTEERGLLEFEGYPFFGCYINGEFYLSVGDQQRKVVFPDGTDGGIPFPWLLLTW